MRLAGSIAPGSCVAVLTGQAVFFSPALTALTSAMLSFLVRPLIVGTVIGGFLAAESLPVPLVVLDVVPAFTVAGVEAVDELVALVTPAAEATAGADPSGKTSPA